MDGVHSEAGLVEDRAKRAAALMPASLPRSCRASQLLLISSLPFKGGAGQEENPCAWLNPARKKGVEGWKHPCVHRRL
jgi:hypothetical protein